MQGQGKKNKKCRARYWICRNALLMAGAARCILWAAGVGDWSPGSGAEQERLCPALASLIPKPQGLSLAFLPGDARREEEDARGHLPRVIAMKAGLGGRLTTRTNTLPFSLPRRGR